MPRPRRPAADGSASHMDRELAALAEVLPRGGGGTGDDPLVARATLREVVAAMGAAIPPAGQTVTDRSIPGPAGAPAVAVRVYEPAPGGGPSPALVYCHGGGFVAGDLDSDDSRCMTLADRAGCVVVSVDYRLAPEHRFPAAFEDCYAVLCWLARTDELGVDGARIGVGGASAGAGLAAAVALMARDRDGPAVAFQMLAAPVLDDRMTTASMRFVGTPLFDGPAAAQMWRHYLGAPPNEAEPGSFYAAPARAHDLRGLPETYIMTSELDPLRDEGLDYALRLLAAGVPVELHHYAGAFHGFEHLPAALSRRATDEQIEWIRRVAA
jgi:acetyl esterase/lipase